MTFAYTARDPLGNMHDGTIDATSLDEAKQLLLRDGFSVLKIGEDDGGSLFPKRIRRTDIINVTTQLAIMVDTGITLSAALDGIAEQEENPTLKALLLDLQQGVEGGDDFSKVLAKHPKQFDATYRALIQASEQTGQLAEMLETIASYMQKELETKSKVKAAMAYPMVMAGVAIAVTVFLLTYILPKFEPLFSRKGVQLPKITVVLMTVSNSLLGYWWAWLLGAIALTGAFLYFRSTEFGRRTIDQVKISMPVLGPVFRKITISRSVRTLGTMIASGVSILEALKMASAVAGNYHYQLLWSRVHDEVTTGSRICESVGRTPLLPSTLVQMIGSGEETAKLDEVLQKVSVHYDSEVETAIKTATSMIEPVMICVMGIIVGGIAMGLLLPIFSLSRGH